MAVGQALVHLEYCRPVPCPKTFILSRVDGVVFNDAESRQYSVESNLVQAAYANQEAGPKLAIIKKREHGCLVFNGDSVFPFPGYPLENVVDPTGAGDSFAGGLMGYLADLGASAGAIDDVQLRTAVAYGTVMGSFAVEDFSLNRLANLTKRDVDSRFDALKTLTKF